MQKSKHYPFCLQKLIQMFLPLNCNIIDCSENQLKFHSFLRTFSSIFKSFLEKIVFNCIAKIRHENEALANKETIFIDI